MGGVEGMEFSKNQIYSELAEVLKARLEKTQFGVKECVLNEGSKNTMLEMFSYVFKLYEVCDGGVLGDYYIEINKSNYDEDKDDFYYQVSGVGCVGGSGIRCCSYIVEGYLEAEDLVRCVECIISDLKVVERLTKVLEDSLCKEYEYRDYHRQVWFK